MNTNMKNIIDKTWKFAAGGSTVLAYQAWWERIKNAESNTVMRETLDGIRDDLQEVKQTVHNISNVEKKNELLEHVKAAKENLTTMNEKAMKFYEMVDKGTIRNNKETLSDFKEDLRNGLQNISESVEKLNKGVKNLFNSDNTLSNVINDFKAYLSTLSTTDLCILMNITTSLFILACLLSIIFAVYGNVFIEKFNLEKRFPKLSGLIKWRVKLQHMTIIVNSILIIIGLILLIYVNTMTLIYV